MGLISSNQLSLFKMKHIYIDTVDENKVEFLEGDHRTAISTFYFDDDIKSECFTILSKLKKPDTSLDFVNIYHKDNKIYAINDCNVTNLSGKTIPIITGCYYASDKIIPTYNGFNLKDEYLK